MPDFSENELAEIEKISKSLLPGEEVLFVATQGRIVPGGSLTTPNTIFATNRRVIIRNPSLLGLRAGVEDYSYKSITGVKVEKGIFSSKVYITIPGLGGMESILRQHGIEEAELAAIPHEKAIELRNIINNGIIGLLSDKKVSLAYPVPIDSPVERIKKLKELFDNNLITEEEFERRKSEILKEI